MCHVPRRRGIVSANLIEEEAAAFSRESTGPTPRPAPPRTSQPSGRAAVLLCCNATARSLKYARDRKRHYAGAAHLLKLSCVRVVECRGPLHTATLLLLAALQQSENKQTDLQTQTTTKNKNKRPEKYAYFFWQFFFSFLWNF